MSLGRLLFELKDLITAPEENFNSILKLLEAHQDLAEYEVARCWIAKVMRPAVAPLVNSRDPEERMQALRFLKAMASTSTGTLYLRQLVKDPNANIRNRARTIVNNTTIADVALRDTRCALRHYYGQYNKHGWSFGMFRSHGTYRLTWRGAGPSIQPPLAPESERSQLPTISSVQELCQFLELPNTQALASLTRPGSGLGRNYIDFEIPKAKGGLRLISAPKAPLRRVQRKLYQELLAKLPTHDSSHGFVKGRSTVTNAELHKQPKLLIKTDIRDFFPSIHYYRVAGLMRHYGYSQAVATALASLMTRRDVIDQRIIWPGALPQGAPTSPAISNLVCRRLDTRLLGLAKKSGAVYSRYADDLSFSWQEPGELKVGRFFWWVNQILQQEGFVENMAKRKVIRDSQQLRITGLVVNHSTHLPRRERKRFRAILHNCERHGLESQAGEHKDFKSYLKGYVSYAKMVQPKLGVKWQAQLDKILSQS